MEDSVKKEYEAAFLVREEQDASAIEEIISKKGEFKSKLPLRKQVLAYKIGKDTTAFLGVVRFFATGEVAKELEQELQMNTSIIRSLIVKAEKEEVENKERAAKKPETEEKKDVVLSNEDLVKQIEELVS